MHPKVLSLLLFFYIGKTTYSQCSDTVGQSLISAGCITLGITSCTDESAYSLGSLPAGTVIQIIYNADPNVGSGTNNCTNSNQSIYINTTPVITPIFTDGVDPLSGTKTVTLSSAATELRYALGFSGCNSGGGGAIGIGDFIAITNPGGPCAPTVFSGSTWTWTGCQDPNWFNPCNWDRGSIPVTTSNVIVPNSLNNPIINGGAASCLDINIQSSTGAEVTITSSGSLDVTL